MTNEVVNERYSQACRGVRLVEQRRERLQGN